MFINISIKAFHPSTTDFVDICDIPDDYLPTHNLIINYVTQVGTPMLFQIHPLKKKASVYGVNELKNDWLIRQVFTYISKAYIVTHQEWKIAYNSNGIIKMKNILQA